MTFRWTGTLRDLLICRNDDGNGGGGGGGNSGGDTSVTHENWAQHLGGEGLGEHNAVLKYKAESAEDMVAVPRGLVQGFVNAQELIGRDKLPMPSTPEEFSETFRKLGAPEKADGYKFDIPEGVTEEQKAVLQDVEQWFRQAAYEKGLLPDQAETIFSKMSESLIGDMNKLQSLAEAKIAEGEAAMKDKWGADYEGNLNLVDRIVKQYGGKELADELTATGMLRSPLLLGALRDMAGDLGEAIGFDQKGGSGPKTVAEIKAEAKTLMADPAYTNKSDPRHTTVVAAVTRKFEQMHGGK